MAILGHRPESRPVLYMHDRMVVLAALIAANIVVPPLASAIPWQGQFVKLQAPGQVPFFGRRSFGALRRVSATPWERHSLVTAPLQGAPLWEHRPSMAGPTLARMTPAMSTEDVATPQYSSAHVLDSCPGDDNIKCDYDSDHRICAQLLDTDGKPLNWGDHENFWSIQHLMPRTGDSDVSGSNGGANKCINMALTASLIQSVGCENVHIHCDATDLSYVKARNWWAYGRSGLSLAPAANCLHKLCAPDMSWEMMGLSDKAFKGTGVAGRNDKDGDEASLEEPMDAFVALATPDANAMKLAYKECEDVTKAFSKTFYIGTALMRPAARRHAWAIYAWCRRTDDIVDSPQAQLNPDVLDSDLEEWVRRLDGIWNQRPTDMYDLAMADTVRAYPTLDIQPFRDMIDGMIMDVPGHAKGKIRYETFDELYVYCYRVAGTVGMMMLPILGTADGVTEEEAKEPATALGIALQLTNILRDVGEDLKRGRIYLPLDELKQFGLTEEDMFACKVTPKYKEFMKFQIARARDYYAEATRGIPMLAPDARFAVRASMDLYGRILRKIEENDYDNFNKRAYTTGFEKLGILPGSWMKSMQREAILPAPAASLVSAPHDADESSEGSVGMVLAGVTVAGVTAGAVVATALASRRQRPPDSAEPMLG